MTKWTGAVILALTLMFGSAAANSAASSSSQTAVQQPHASKATDLGARRGVRHHDRYAYRPYYPAYYDRPYYYAPAPFFPFLGLGYGPWW
jgi:hypothetical protein